MLQSRVLLSALVLASVSKADLGSKENSIGVSADTLIEFEVNMADKIKTLEAKVEKFERLEDKIVSLEEELQMKNEKIAKMEHVMEALVAERNSRSKYSADRHDKQLLTKYKHRGKRQSEVVAFSAKSTNHLQHIGKKVAIKFNEVLLNDGNCYEPNTGIFAAPMIGTYLFIYNFGHHGTGETWLELVKNGVAQNGAAVEGHFGQQNLQGGNAAIIRLNQGDTVWVETYLVSDVSLHANTTTFSGVFLY